MINQLLEIDYSVVKSLPDLLAFLRRSGVPENSFWPYISAFQEKKARETGIPLNGLFELTPLCNLDCKMCYVHLNRDQLNGASVLSVENWKNIMSQAHAMGMMNATLTGGECLTYPGFDELYLFLRSLGVKASIKTNGLLLTGERMDFFDKYPPRSITVSLYGSSNEVYQRVTGHAVFDTVYDHLLRLKEVHYPVEIAVTPTRDMYDDTEHVLDLVHQLGFPCFINIMLFQPREETGRKLCDLTNDEYAEIFRKARRADSSNNVSDDKASPSECRQQKEDHPHSLRCGAGRSMFFVSWHGMMSACENLNGLQIDLLKNPFSDAWKRIHSDILCYPLPAECRRCEFEKECFHCVAYRGSGAKPGHCNPNICERTRLFSRERIRLR